MMADVTVVVLVLSLGLCAYVYVGYPLLLVMLGAVLRRDVQKQDMTPFLSVIIPAHNEERVIAEKLQNTLELNYPTHRRTIIVASDGSTDATEEIVSRYETRGVRLLRLPRRGKAAALNAAVAEASGELVVFTDANALLERHALRRLVSPFADRQVGGVCGHQQYRMVDGGDSARQGESLYWTYDTWIKRLESRLGSTYAADGSLYAIRRSLVLPLVDPAQADDLAISARVVTQGARLVFEPAAISYEDPPAAIEQEFWRKVRVATQTWRGMLLLRDAMNPWRHGFYSLVFLSHQVLRYLVPFALPVVLAANAALASRSGAYQLLLVGQLLCYGCAAVGWALRRSRWGRFPLFYGPLYFCVANIAVFLGACWWVRGDRIVTWQPQRELVQT